ncbi:MAG: NAD(P)H-dependent oxidoreductase [Edaphocola sp.]
MDFQDAACGQLANFAPQVPLFMITVISGTNRPGSRTLQVATHYFNLIKATDTDAHLLSLENINTLARGSDVLDVETRLLVPSEKFVLVMPEYNGSFPGVLKALFDNSDIKKAWWHKKVALVGVADGRGGNLRGIEHMTNILHYLRMNVFYNKLPLSKINEEMDVEGDFINEVTINAIQDQVNGFMEY